MYKKYIHHPSYTTREKTIRSNVYWENVLLLDTFGWNVPTNQPTNNTHTHIHTHTPTPTRCKLPSTHYHHSQQNNIDTTLSPQQPKKYKTRTIPYSFIIFLDGLYGMIHTLSLSLSHSLTHSLTLSLSLSLSLSMFYESLSRPRILHGDNHTSELDERHRWRSASTLITQNNPPVHRGWEFVVPVWDVIVRQPGFAIESTPSTGATPSRHRWRTSLNTGE